MIYGAMDVSTAKERARTISDLRREINRAGRIRRGEGRLDARTNVDGELYAENIPQSRELHPQAQSVLRLQ